MKRILILELCFLFLATTFQSDRQTGWVQQTIPRPDLAVQDLQFVDSLTGFVLSSKQDTSFIFKTTDGGNNWQTYVFNISLSYSIFFVNKYIGYMSCYELPNANVKKTTNNGINWYTISTVSSYIPLEDIFFINKDTGFVCSTDITSGGLWRTMNGGVSWQKLLGESYRPTRMFFVNTNTGWFVTENTYYLYKTTNCGMNWFLQTGFNHIPTDVFFASLDTGWIIGVGTNGLMRSINGGSNWDTVRNPITPAETRLFFINNKIGWGGRGFNKIHATKDGYNWGYQVSPIWGNYYVSFVDSLRGWAGYSGLVHTTDGGGEIISEIIYPQIPLPVDFSLEQNYPNPFNQSSIINYKCPIKSDVLLKVYDIMGKEVTTLVNERKDAGSYEVTFNSGDLPSGIYFYRLLITDQIEKIVRFSDTKRMILIK